MCAIAVMMLMAVSACACSGPAVDAAYCGRAPAGFEHADAQVGAERVHHVTGGQGPPVVLLHGFPETWQAWRGVMSRLRAEHRVVAVDLPGLGCSSPHTSAMGKEALARSVHGLVRQLGLGQAAVVGHDMGGMVAYAYARTFPRDTSHLAVSGAVLPGLGLDKLIDPPPGQHGLPHLGWFLTRPADARQAITADPRGFLARFVGASKVPSAPAFDDYVRAYSSRGRIANALRLYRTLPADAQDNRARAPLTMPALALDGQSGMPERVANSLRRAAPAVHAEAIPGAGHYAPEQAPEAFAGSLRQFLR